MAGDLIGDLIGLADSHWAVATDVWVHRLELQLEKLVLGRQKDRLDLVYNLQFTLYSVVEEYIAGLSIEIGVRVPKLLRTPK